MIMLESMDTGRDFPDQSKTEVSEPMGEEQELEEARKEAEEDEQNYVNSTKRTLKELLRDWWSAVVYKWSLGHVYYWTNPENNAFLSRKAKEKLKGGVVIWDAETPEVPNTSPDNQFEQNMGGSNARESPDAWWDVTEWWWRDWSEEPKTYPDTIPWNEENPNDLTSPENSGAWWDVTEWWWRDWSEEPKTFPDTTPWYEEKPNDLTPQSSNTDGRIETTWWWRD